MQQRPAPKMGKPGLAWGSPIEHHAGRGRSKSRRRRHDEMPRGSPRGASLPLPDERAPRETVEARRASSRELETNHGTDPFADTFGRTSDIARSSAMHCRSMRASKVGLIGPNGAQDIDRTDPHGRGTASGARSPAPPGVRLGYVPQVVVNILIRDGASGCARRRSGSGRCAAARRGAAGVRGSRPSTRCVADEPGAARAAYDVLVAIMFRARRGHARCAGACRAAGAARRPRVRRREERAGARPGACWPSRICLSSTSRETTSTSPGSRGWSVPLRCSRGGVLIVSHNRYLLDRVAGHDRRIAGRAHGRVRRQLLRVSRDAAAREAEPAGGLRRQPASPRSKSRRWCKRFRELASRTGDRLGQAPAGARSRSSRANRNRQSRSRRPRHPRCACGSRRREAGPMSRCRCADTRAPSASCGCSTMRTLEIACGERVALHRPERLGEEHVVRDAMTRGAWDDAVIRIGPSLRVGYCAQEQEVLDDSGPCWTRCCAKAFRATGRSRCFRSSCSRAMI